MAVRTSSSSVSSSSDPLLLSGYQGIAQQLGATDFRTMDALNRLVDLYVAWGRPALAGVYRKRLAGVMEASEAAGP